MTDRRSSSGVHHWGYDAASGRWIGYDAEGNQTASQADPPREAYGSDDEWVAASAAERTNEANAEHDARWDEMSWEERQAARGRGEHRSTESGGEAGTDTNTWNDWSRGTPLEGWFGEGYDQEAAEAARLAAERAALLGDLAEFMPGEDALSVEYGNEDMIGAGEDSLRARDAWREWSEGGLTDTDRAMMEDSRRNSGRAARANREADLAALEARGMGGSGASLAAMLSAGEGAADRNASMDATMMGAAQQRQMAATNALGEFGAREDDYARGREGRNTDRENRTRESAATAAQQAHENRQDYTTLGLGMNPNGGTNDARDRRDEEEDELFGAVGGTIDTLFS